MESLGNSGVEVIVGDVVKVGVSEGVWVNSGVSVGVTVTGLLITRVTSCVTSWVTIWLTIIVCTIGVLPASDWGGTQELQSRNRNARRYILYDREDWEKIAKKIVMRVNARVLLVRCGSCEAARESYGTTCTHVFPPCRAVRWKVRCSLAHQ